MRGGIASRNSGLCLIEVALVVAIVAIFAAIAAPRYGHAAGRYRLDLAARRVAADLRLAQSSARAASASRTVVFTPATDRYQLQGVVSPDGSTGDYTVWLGVEPYGADLAGADFNGVSQVVFSGWGLPNCSGVVTLNVGSQQKTVAVDVQTGRVSIP